MVLPMSLQQKIAEEAEAKKNGDMDQIAVPGPHNEERKNAERKMRRASIAAGVMSALAKQGSLPTPDTGQKLPKEVRKSQKRDPKRTSSIKAALKQNFRSSIFSSGLSGIMSMPSGMNIPFLDAKGSSGIPSMGISSPLSKLHFMNFSYLLLWLYPPIISRPKCICMSLLVICLELVLNLAYNGESKNPSSSEVKYFACTSNADKTSRDSKSNVCFRCERFIY